MIQRRQPRRKSSRHRRRLLGLQALALVALGSVGWRLIDLRMAYGQRLAKAAVQADTVTGVLTAPRGKLLDSSGQPIAMDVPAYVMDVNIQALRAKLPQLVSLLANVLGESDQTVSNFVTSGNYSWLQFRSLVVEQQKEQITAGLQKLDPNQVVGNLVSFTPTEKRVYPDGVFASNLIGYVNSSGGAAGLEQQYNSDLTGTSGKYQYTVQADGFPVQTTYKVTQPEKPGDTVKTTINQAIQAFVDESMDALVNKFHPSHAAAIVMDPQTGAVLAMASRPTFDPNHWETASSEALNTNWAVNSVFEPGSTFKPVVLAAALTTHKIKLNQTFMSGQITIDGSTIHDWNWWGWGKLTFLGALEKSSNVGFATIATRLGWPDLIKYMKRFGFLKPTGIGLPNEADSIIFSPQNRGPVQLATSGFGQGIAVTPLQQMAAIGAIANGGALYRPYVVSSITDPSTGKVIEKVGPHVVHQHVVPESVANTVRQAMIDDVNAPAGIDFSGRINGYEVAGKTGTAQVPKPGGGYYSNRYIVSFIGYAPGWDPKIEVYVTVKRPKAPLGSTWGSTIAAPTARAIMKFCLQYEHIMPRGVSTPSSAAAIPSSDRTTYEQMPTFTGQTVTAAKALAKRDSLGLSVIGSGKVVDGQWPAASTEVTSGTTVYLSTAAVGGGAMNVTMPNLVGAPMRTAGEILAALGLNMNPVGNGFVGQQSVPPGTPIAKGSTVTLTFSPNPPAVITKASGKAGG